MFRNFKRYKLFRKCGLPSAAHVNRVGAVSTIIDINDPGSRLYSAIAVGHDFIEDLLYKAVDEDGVHYSFKRYTEFVEKFIPEELRQGILILTNHYDIVVRHIAEYLDNYNLGLNKNSVYDSVKELLSEKGNDGVINGYLNSDDELPQSNIPSSIQEYAQKTLDLILDLPADKMKFEDIRWACYTELYLKDLAALSKKADNFRFFEIKSFDLSDNGHGIGSLSMDARIRNLLKQEAWAREGYQFNTEWAPINKRIMELNEDILVFAEYFVIKDLLELQSLQDFLISALYKIRRLDKIFYTD
ncbi:MAG: hypothetical protein K8F28_10015 [Ignavibacteriaceae bacterium]|nr:hypothetical protein [Ignavibacteriaceae bacterium]